MEELSRKALQDVINQVERLRSIIMGVLNDEEYNLDNIPYNVKHIEEYEKAEDSICYLDDSLKYLDLVVYSIEKAIDKENV